MSAGIGRRLRRELPGLVATVAAVMALCTTATLTLGGFTSSIKDTAGTFSAATVIFTEAAGGTTCYSNNGSSNGSSSGSVSSLANTGCTINMLNGALDQVPGGTALTETVTVANTGNHTPSAATLALGSCSAAAASDAGGYVGGDTNNYCANVDITIQNGHTGFCMYPYSASAACGAPTNTYTLAGVASQTTTSGATCSGAATLCGLSIPTNAGFTYTVTVELDSGVATNADQGLTATMPFTWSISQ